MKTDKQIKELNKKIFELEQKLDKKTLEVLDKNIEIAELKRNLFIALGFITATEKK